MFIYLFIYLLADHLAGGEVALGAPLDTDYSPALTT
jgi:hypothetical protein